MAKTNVNGFSQSVRDAAQELLVERYLSPFVMEALYHARGVALTDTSPVDTLSFKLRFDRLIDEHAPTIARVVADALFRAYCQASVRSAYFISPGYLSVSTHGQTTTFTLELIGVPETEAASERQV